MFAKQIVDSDAFLEMPLSTQALYFHLAMRADDDGFINNPKRVQRLVGASEDDCRLLVSKHFLIPFESGVVVIKHWRLHNYIAKDRYKPTVYQEEMACLCEKENRVYTKKDPLYTECIQNVDKLYTQNRLEKSSLNKSSVEGEYMSPTLDEVKNFVFENKIPVNPEKFFYYYEAVKWQKAGQPITDWQSQVRLWAARDKAEAETKATEALPPSFNLEELEAKMLSAEGVI